METSQQIREHVERAHGPNKNVDLIDTFVRKQQQRSLAKRLSYEREIGAATDPIVSRDKELATLAMSLLNLRNEFLILYQALETKVTYLALSSIWAFSNDDHLLLLLCGKGLIDNTASVAYLIRQTNETFERIEVATESGLMNRDIGQLCRTYRKRFYAAGFLDCAAVPAVINMPPLVDKYLASEIKDIKAYYEYLLDLVQPISDHLALDSDQGSGEDVVDPRLTPHTEQKREIMDKVLRIARTVVECVDRQLEIFASLGLMIDAYTQKAFDPSTTLAALFAERPAHVAVPETLEGPSKETATFYEKDGKVWLRLSDGTSFETPLKSIGDVMPEQEVTVYSREGKTWLSLDDGTSFETPLEPVTTKQLATFFDKDGRVWARLGDGTSFVTPLKSIGDVAPEQEVTLSTSEGRTWLTLDDGTSFATPIKSLTSEQTVSFFDKDGKVWLRLADGTSFETPLKSLEGISLEQQVAFFDKDGKVWLTLADGTSFETPLKSVEGRPPAQKATFFDKDGKVWLRLADGTSFQTPLKSVPSTGVEQKATLFDRDGKVWLRLRDGTAFVTPLKSVTTREIVAFFDKDGKIWARLPDGFSFVTPLKSIGEAGPRQLVTFFDKGGRTWLTIGHGVSFETPLKTLASRQVATFFDKDGKIWARLGDGIAFATPLKSIGDVTARQSVMLFTRRGHIWLRLDRGPAFETPLDSVSPRRTHLFFSKRAKIWLKYGEQS